MPSISDKLVGNGYEKRGAFPHPEARERQLPRPRGAHDRGAAIAWNRHAVVFGGPYSNLEATRAVLDEATRLSISADRIICTGDVVAYGADAAATVDLVRDRVGHVVMGN
jgi:hypothetical protein